MERAPPPVERFLSLLTADEVQKLRRQVRFKRFDKGQVVFHQGDPSDGVYTVWTGCIAVSVGAANGRTHLLQMVHPGQSIGELSVFDGGARPATAKAQEVSTLAFLNRRDFLALVTGRPELTIWLVGMLIDGVRHQRSMVAEVRSLTVPRRLANLVLELLHYHAAPDEKSKMPSLRFSQRELAEMLGLSRVWVSQELIKWRDVGIVELRRSRLIIRDQAALVRLAADPAPTTI